MRKITKKIISLLLVELSLLSCAPKKETYSSSISHGLVTYDTSIGKISISEVEEDLDNDGINVLDLRYIENPSMKVKNSCYIKKISDISEVVDVLQDYNDKYNNGYSWNRDSLSMKLEWITHNILFDLGISTDHTIDVDFNNDEFKNILKNK